MGERVTRLSADYGDDLSAVIASRDPAKAAALLDQVKAAVAAGSASGFDGDMAKLAAIAGVPLVKAAPARAEPLQKRATRQLPAQLQAEAEAAIAAIEAATGRLQKAAAMEEGRRVKQRLDDYWQNVAATAELQKAHRAPKSIRGMWK